MGLEDFKSFVKSNNEEKKLNLNVWLYTRVSSKDQEMNKSLANQKEAGYSYAKEKNYVMTETFGGTYESASGDFTRKEFSKLIQEIRNSRQKPFAILIYTMSRFSRTGGNGISLAYELVEQLGVNLIEVSSGKNTITVEGRLEIYGSLLKASQENVDRLKVTMPGMKKLLENGNWLGKAPRGYDQFGHRVKNRKFYNETPLIKINNEGLILKQAWNWKVQNESDHIIINKLADLGIKVNPQTLSKMWRNTFYCGISVNKLLGKAIYGNWEKLVSEQDFLYVQEILKGNHSGYKHEKANPNRPLNAFICCSECGGKLSGYEVKKKKVHYYKCQSCKDATINADTTKRARGEGAHNLFFDLLSTYQLPKELIEPFIVQLKLTFETLSNEKAQEEKSLKEQLEKQTASLKSLQRKYAMEGLEKEIYEEYKTEIEAKIAQINETLKKVESKISNLDKYIYSSVEVASNISKYWASGSLETKKRIQDLVFSGSLIIDMKKRVYLTKKVNSVFTASSVLSRLPKDVNEKSTDFLSMLSPSVAGG